MKRYIILILASTLLLVSCDNRYAMKEQVTDFIPPEADYIFIFHDSKGIENDIKENTFANILDKSPAFQSLVDNAFLSQFPLTSKSLLALSTKKDSTHYLIATHLRSQIGLQDSLASKTIDSIAIKKGWLQQVKLKKQTLFTTVIDSFMVVSNEKEAIVSVMEGKTLQAPEVKKLINLHTEGNLQVLFKNSVETLRLADEEHPKTWQGYHIQIPPESLQTTGVTFIQDSVPSTLWLLQGQQPQEHNTLNIVPLEAEKTTSFPLSDASLFFERVQHFDPSLTEEDKAHFDSVREIAHSKMDGGNILIIESVLPDVFLSALPLSQTIPSTYRDVSIYTQAGITATNKPLQALFDTQKLTTFFTIDTFFVFTENEAVAQKVISSYLNKSVLATHPQFQDENNVLTTMTSLMHIHTNSKNNHSLQLLAPEINSTSQAIPFSALQYTVEDSFAHVHLSLLGKKTIAQTTSGVTEKERITLNEVLLHTPQFFTNHRTKAKEIVLQDITNTLYLYSQSGKKLWSTTLDSPILGTIEEIDLLRNGKKQLAFVTEKAFHVLDRNGNAVAPFPITFKDNITQPLAVFDYDNNRKYRFVITQDDEVLMYNAEGKQVKGFTYNKAPASIVMPPQHFRIGNKDYITVASKNGKLDILSRTGKTRIPLSTNFRFGTIALQKEGNSFVVISEDNKKHSIATSGKISTQVLDVSPNYHFAMEGKTKVTLDDNLLRINGRLIELPFGLYTTPTVFTSKGVTYVSVTDTQEKKVYVYSNYKLLEGFPVYGTKKAFITSNGSKKLVLVQGDDKELLRYTF